MSATPPMGTYSGFIHRLTRIPGLGPLTPRAVIVLLALLYLLLGPISSSSDIVSAGLAYGGLTVITSLVALVVGHGLLMERWASVQVFPPQTSVTSSSSARLVLHLSPIRILPLTHLDLFVEFEHPLAQSTLVRITGASKSTRAVYLDITFPHRGPWTIRGVRCTLGDITGLAQHSWQCQQESSVIVTPPLSSEAKLPILSSTQRAGDLVIDNLNRQGDPFDIKAYHPSDGVKKIVWKAFAKRGELLTRHPEASMTPEGYVVILVVAGPTEDAVCSRALAYVRSLDELRLDIVIGCQGGRGRIPATSPETAESLLVESVWEATHDSQEKLRADATALLDYCQESLLGIKLNKLLIFCSGDRLSTESDARNISELATWLETQGIRPVFCVTPPSNGPAGTALVHTTLSARLFMLPEASERAAVNPLVYHDFLSGCLHKQWEVHV